MTRETLHPGQAHQNFPQYPLTRLHGLVPEERERLGGRAPCKPDPKKLLASQSSRLVCSVCNRNGCPAVLNAADGLSRGVPRKGNTTIASRMQQHTVIS